MAAPDAHAAIAAVTDNPEAGHQANVFPPFDAHNFLPQLVWLVIIFGLLYWLMSRIALPRVEGILQARRSRIAQDIDSARSMQDQADAAEKHYEATLADAKGRAQALAQDTHDRLHAAAETRRHALEEELNGKLAAAEAQIAETRGRAMGNVDSIAREAAASIVQHLTGRTPDEAALMAAANAVKA